MNPAQALINLYQDLEAILDGGVHCWPAPSERGETKAFKRELTKANTILRKIRESFEECAQVVSK